MDWRYYNAQTDREPVLRILREVGWLHDGDEKDWDLMLRGGRPAVALQAGEPECLALTTPGVVCYTDEDLPLTCVAAVATSRVARKRGLAGLLTAYSLADRAAEGALVAVLGMFEQGFYTRLGFGVGSYSHRVSFDPALLTVAAPERSPRRVTRDDWESAHACRLARRRVHGACSLSAPEVTRAGMLGKRDFGLGYFDGPGGTLSHHLWCSAGETEHGPINVKWMAYQTPEQFVELMGVLKTLGDQAYLVTLFEPQGIQLQDLISQPVRHHETTRRSRYACETRAYAWWQMRILDLGGCLARTRLRGGEVRFNLHLHDPIERFLEQDARWRGISGEYVVTLGAQSGAEPGLDATLPTLEASVPAFTRLWLGVRPATGLAVTDDLHGPAELLDELDWALRLPAPFPDWEF